jgi:hypothetical protein
MKDAIPEHEAQSVPMAKIAAGSPVPSCHSPVSETGFEQNQCLDPDPFSPRARERAAPLR